MIDFNAFIFWTLIGIVFVSSYLILWNVLQRREK